MSSDPVIRCPACKTEIKLTESLAAPLLESTRRSYEERMAAHDAAVHAKEKALAEKQAALVRDREAVDRVVEEKVEAARAAVAVEEGRKAKAALADELHAREKAAGELREQLAAKEAKLAEAQKAQADFLRRQRELDDARRELELTVEKRVGAALVATREQARKEAEESLQLKVAEREQTIASMQRQIEELKRRAEQGSQQLQGEVQELELERLLGATFPHDEITPVPKGEFGGDALQQVRGPAGQTCGVIIWETKRTKNWSEGWLAKLRDDQRAAKADLAVLVSHALPKGMETFGMIDQIWVAHPTAALPLAMSLRQTLIEVALARQAMEGQQTKTEMIYHYLTGPRFRQRVEAIVEAFSSMQVDLDREKKAILRQWAKREEQINRVMQSTVGMYGDLQGIAGSSLAEIEGLEFPALGEGDGGPPREA
ncbi:MAG TPA: DUF2130 domain-containing protein [Kiritimatiellia bacterium]|nr:DUF2130 domain-containing protein [Kiritimatiellia bacterium]